MYFVRSILAYLYLCSYKCLKGNDSGNNAVLIEIILLQFYFYPENTNVYLIKYKHKIKSDLQGKIYRTENMTQRA